MGSISTPPKTVSTTLNYHWEDGPDHFWAGTVGEKRRKHVPTKVNVRDIRGEEQSFSVDVQGFELVQHESPETDFQDDAIIKDVYWKDCCDLLKSRTGASSVYPMAHVVRRRNVAKVKEEEKEMKDMDRSNGPSYVTWVHVDQDYDGAWQRVQDAHPELKEKLHQCRWAIINVWRPIDTPCTRDALCMADARSIPEESLRSVMIKFPANESENKDPNLKDPYANRPDFGAFAVMPPSGPDEHKWYYASEMQENEALLLKTFDTKTDGSVSRRSPHSAFVSEFDHGPDRHSLDVRCLVFWDDQALE